MCRSIDLSGFWALGRDRTSGPITLDEHQGADEEPVWPGTPQIHSLAHMHTLSLLHAHSFTCTLTHTLHDSAQTCANSSPVPGSRPFSAVTSQEQPPLCKPSSPALIREPRAEQVLKTHLLLE